MGYPYKNEKVIVDAYDLVVIADFIRYKLGEETNPNAVGFTKYNTVEMGVKMSQLPFAKDAIPDSAKRITGNCESRFANGGWDWFIEQLGEEITTEGITDCGSMFSDSNLKKIPFVINCAAGYINLTSMFINAKLKELPKIIAKVEKTSYMFSGCKYLREIPEDYFDNFDWSYITNLTSSYSGNMSSMFQNCFSLRYIPVHKLQINPKSSYSYTYFSYGFQNCRVLDELVNLPVYHNTVLTNNCFSSGFEGCSRLKKLTFALNDGQPYVVNWKNQVIDLSQTLGFTGSTYESIITEYNSGITADKKVKDDATYQALKNDKDWYCVYTNYSRYNHDSAVETINSLPDTSAYLAANGGTNTIKFKGEAGSATDGGAINTLTEAEIAVAAAKGWTVSLV